MHQRTNRTQGGDAPLAQAKRPDATALSEATPETTADDSIVGRTVTINRPRSELYAFWRDFTNLPRFMDNVQEVKVLSDRRSHWTVKAPAGMSVEWDAIVTEERPEEFLAWASTEDSSIRHSGSVEFRDARGGRGTSVTATIVYDAPAGGLGKAVAKLFGREPKIQARRDLRRFKQLMEAGEIAVSEPPEGRYEPPTAPFI